MKLYGTFAVQVEQTFCMEVDQEDWDAYLLINPDFDQTDEMDAFAMWNYFEDLGLETVIEESETIDGELMEVVFND